MCACLYLCENGKWNAQACLEITGIVPLQPTAANSETSSQEQCEKIVDDKLASLGRTVNESVAICPYEVRSAIQSTLICVSRLTCSFFFTDLPGSFPLSLSLSLSSLSVLRLIERNSNLLFDT